jgi:hypothetical protein
MLALAWSAPAASLQPAQLRCEFRDSALGVDAPRPRLSWLLTATDPGARGLQQTAARILVASSAAILARDEGDLWDSGKLPGDSTTLIPYGGAALATDQTVFWKVRVWDARKRASAWSAPATWTMGVVDPADWQARWIGAPPSPADATSTATTLLRREFTVRPGLVRALIHVTGVGHYDLSINGAKVGDQLLSPGWTDYRKTVLYDTFDVTAHLRAGAPNALGIVLGNGMYHVPQVEGRYTKFTGSQGPRQAIARLRLDYADGTSELVPTDARWQIAPGPITFCHVYGGEDYDARLEPSGWDRPAFTAPAAAPAWSPAAELSGPGGELRGLSHAAPPLRTIEELRPVAVREIRPGLVVYDLGQNASLMPRLSVRGPAGSRVRITPAELLRADGTVDRGSVGRPPAHWQYTLAGTAAPESWFPRFFYHGSRYLQVESSPASPGETLPRVESLIGVVVHTSSAPVGDFATSSDLFNRIRALVRWAQRSNLVSVITDCPHREKLGWLEQYHLNGPSLRYEHDLGALFGKTFQDMADAQTPEGLVTSTAPEYSVFKDGFRDSPEWGSALILAAWQQYVFTGDTAPFALHYDAMCRYVAYLGTQSRDHLLSHGLGDWYDVGPKKPGRAQLTPPRLTATAIYYEDLLALSRIASLLGKPDDAARHAALAGEVKAAFNRDLFRPDTGVYATGSQTANAMPLVLGLVEPTRAPAVLDAIVADIRARGDALSAGDVGYRYLLRALADGGRSDVVFTMNNQSEKPGYGYQLARGATSLTEAWNADPRSSQNHFMLGQITEWFYHDLAGIQPDASAPGFRRFVIKPAFVGDLTWVRASYDSPQGKITSAWRRTADRLELDLVITPNTSASVHVPAADPHQVMESGKAAYRAKGIRLLRHDSGHAVFTVGSGTYRFTAPLPLPEVAP